MLTEIYGKVIKDAQTRDDTVQFRSVLAIDAIAANIALHHNIEESILIWDRICSILAADNKGYGLLDRVIFDSTRKKDECFNRTIPGSNDHRVPFDYYMMNAETISKFYYYADHYTTAEQSKILEVSVQYPTFKREKDIDWLYRKIINMNPYVKNSDDLFRVLDNQDVYFSDHVVLQNRIKCTDEEFIDHCHKIFDHDWVSYRGENLKTVFNLMIYKEDGSINKYMLSKIRTSVFDKKEVRYTTLLVDGESSYLGWLTGQSLRSIINIREYGPDQELSFELNHMIKEYAGYLNCVELEEIKDIVLSDDIYHDIMTWFKSICIVIFERDDIQSDIVEFWNKCSIMNNKEMLNLYMVFLNYISQIKKLKLNCNNGINSADPFDHIRNIDDKTTRCYETVITCAERYVYYTEKSEADITKFQEDVEKKYAKFKDRGNMNQSEARWMTMPCGF